MRYRSSGEICGFGFGADERVHRRSEASELLEVGGGESIEHPTALRGELEPHETSVATVAVPAHQAGPLGPVDELDRAVVAEQEMLGDVTDRRIVGPGVTPHRQQELVLLARQAGGGGLVLTPAQEAPQAGSELQ